MTGRRVSTRDCTAHLFGDIESRPAAMGEVSTVFRARCSCGWSTPWWASVIALVSDVHAHRHARRRGRRLGMGACR